MSRSKSLAKSLATSSLTEKAVIAAAPETVAVNLTTDITQMQAMPSPALDLQENLRHAWTPVSSSPKTSAGQRVDERKIPIGWALTAAVLGSGAVWAGVAVAISKLF